MPRKISIFISDICNLILPDLAEGVNRDFLREKFYNCLRGPAPGDKLLEQTETYRIYRTVLHNTANKATLGTQGWGFAAIVPEAAAIACQGRTLAQLRPAHENILTMNLSLPEVKGSGANSGREGFRLMLQEFTV